MYCASRMPSPVRKHSDRSVMHQCNERQLIAKKPMGKLIAVGDIHGRLAKLEDLVEQIGLKTDDTLVFLGDYIDGGAHSYQVVEYVIQLKKNFPNVVTLRGNHEDFVISLFMGNLNLRDREIWLTMNGGKVTLASYRNKGHHLNVHQEFYMSLKHSFETEEYFFLPCWGSTRCVAERSAKDRSPGDR